MAGVRIVVSERYLTAEDPEQARILDQAERDHVGGGTCRPEAVVDRECRDRNAALLEDALHPVPHERVIVRRRDTGFARCASKFGSSESEVGGHFIRERALIRNLVTADSQLRWLRWSGTQSPRVLADVESAWSGRTCGHRHGGAVQA